MTLIRIAAVATRESGTRRFRGESYTMEVLTLAAKVDRTKPFRRNFRGGIQVLRQKFGHDGQQRQCNTGLTVLEEKSELEVFALCFLAKMEGGIL